MREPYISVVGLAQAETARAFCFKNPTFMLDGVEYQHGGDLWIPKANIMEDSLDTIEEAAREDSIEIFVAKWWMREQT